jgi:integrase
MANSTTLKRGRKPKAKKPRPDFPLFPHARGYWAKKVRGKLIYFGKIADDPEGEAAVNKWLDEKDALLAGRTPRVHLGGLTVEDLCDHFLNAKRPLVTGGEITKRTFDEYFATGERLVKRFGASRLVDDLRPEDFDGLRAEIAKAWGPVRLGNEIQRIRSVFKFGFEAGHIERPIRFGPMFRKPSRKVIRKARAAKGPRMIEAPELRKLIAAAGVPLKAMILLALNGGLGNSDIGNLPLSAIDLARGWIDYPRPKTGIERRFPLWSETTKALRAAVAKRPTPKDDEARGLAFITKYGKSWTKAVADSPVTKEFRKLLDDADLHRPGSGFYTLRHVFETVAGESRDQVAVDHIMGHARDDMASVYRERISDERLTAVVEHVRGWLYPPKSKGTTETPAKAQKPRRPALKVVSA